MNTFEHLILKPTCLKGLLPSTIDRLLTNHKRNIPPQGDHLGSKFDQDSFNETLKTRVSLPNLSIGKFFEIFHSQIFFAPYKQKNIRHKNPFMTKKNPDKVKIT